MVDMDLSAATVTHVKTQASSMRTTLATYALVTELVIVDSIMFTGVTQHKVVMMMTVTAMSAMTLTQMVMKVLQPLTQQSPQNPH